MGHFKWHLSNKKVGTINLSFVEYSHSKSVHLTPDIVQYKAGAPTPLYGLIIGKQTLYDIGAVLDFKEKTITIDNILLPMRNIVNLQLKPSVIRAMRHNTFQAQEPVSIRNATKRVIEIPGANMTKQLFLLKKYAHVYLRTRDWTPGVESIFCAPGRSYQRACH